MKQGERNLNFQSIFLRDKKSKKTSVSAKLKPFNISPKLTVLYCLSFLVSKRLLLQLITSELFYSSNAIESLY